jgi:hypothetical protein
MNPCPLSVLLSNISAHLAVVNRSTENQAHTPSSPRLIYNPFFEATGIKRGCGPDGLQERGLRLLAEVGSPTNDCS